MPHVDDLDIQISASAEQAEQALDSLINKLDQVYKSFSKSFGSKTKTNTIANTASNATNKLDKYASSANKAAKENKSLASTFGTLYANFFWVIRGIKALNSSIESTADYMESFDYFEVSFGKIADQWSKDFEKHGYDNAESYAESFTDRMNETFSKLSGVQFNEDTGLLSETGLKNLGLNIQEITNYASQLASVSNSIGTTGEVSVRVASSFTKLAGDISSLFNVDYSSVSKNLQSGLIGQSRALYKYGIDITNATLQTYAYELGLEKAVSEMTQAEKMQLRVLAILDQSRVSWGNLANTINSPSNMLRQFTNNMKEAGMMLGQLFIPLLEKVMPVLNGMSIAIKRLLGDIAGFFGGELNTDAFGQGFTDAGEELEDIADGYDAATKAAKKYQNQILGFDEINKLNASSDSGNSSSSMGGSSIDLTEEIKNATDEYERVWEAAYQQMENRAKEFADKIGEYLAPLKKLFSDISIGDWFAVGQDVSNIVSGIFTLFSNAIASVDWQQVGENIGLFLSGINWEQVFDSIGEFIWDAIGASIELWGSAFDTAPIETVIATALATPAFRRKLKEKIGTISLSGLKVNITSISPGTISSAGFVVTADKILQKLEEKLEEAMPDGAYDTISTFVGEMGLIAISGFAGSLFGPLGTVAGIILGVLTSSLAEGEIDGQQIFEKIISKIFNWDYTVALWDNATSFFEEAKKAFEERDWGEVGKNLIQGIINGIGAMLALPFEPVADLFDWIWDGICGIFGIHSPATEMEPLGENILLGIIQGFEDSFNEWTKSIQKWFSEKVAPWFTLEKWNSIFNNIGKSLRSVWHGVVTWWNNSALGKWFNENVKPWFSKDKWSFKGIKEGLSSGFDSAIAAVKGIWNTFANWLNEKLTWNIPAVKVMGKTLFAGTTINLGRIPTFAVGGFPEDGLFMANHNELVGKFSNGRTAVANNQQITDGIRDAVVSGMMEVFMATNNSGDEDSGTREYVFQVDSETIWRISEKGKEKHNRRYNLAT